MSKMAISRRIFIASLSVLSMLAGTSGFSANAPTNGASIDFKHGSLKVSENARFLVHSDGTPFFYLGDTAWELFHRLNREDATLYLENRRQKGFTVIQAVVLAELDGLNTPNAYGDKPLIGNDITKPNEAYFKHVDFVVKTALEKGLYIGMLPTWGDKVGPLAWGTGPEKTITKDTARNYGRFLGERYKDYPNIIWILGGDRSPKGYEPVWKELAAGLEEGDGGSHLMTYHPQGGMSSSETFQKDSWLDFNMLQSSHSARNLANYSNIASDYRRQPTKPCIDGEPRYEDHPINWDPKNGWFDDYDVRQAAYWGVFAGAMGTTYGCHDIWQMWSSGLTPVSFARTPWKESLDLPGAWDMKHLRELMESRPMLTRIPDQSMLSVGSGSGAAAIRITRGEDYAFVYSSAGKPFTLKLGVISGEMLNAYWFNPREGDSMFLGRLANKDTAEFVPPTETTGRGCDWVLILDNESKGYKAPGTLVPLRGASPAPKAPVTAAGPVKSEGALRQPLVELLFDDVKDGSLTNTGSTKDSYPIATLTDNGPVLSSNSRGGDNRKALDFGTKARAYAVDLPGPVVPLADMEKFTITGWLNSTNKGMGAGGNRVVSWINNGVEGVDLVYSSNGSLILSVNEWPDGSPAKSSSKMVTTDSTASSANWIFFAVTYDSTLSTGNAKFYFGSESKPVALDRSIDYDRGAVGTLIGPELTIGHFNTATRNGATDRMFRGLIDDIRIYDNTLTADEIAAVQKL